QPRRSMRAMISPTSPRSTASGLMRINERSRAIERRSLLRGSPSSRSRLEGRELPDRRGLDRSLAVRADLPQGFERRLAVHAGLPQLRRAHRAHEVVRTDLSAADRAVQVAAREAVLHRADLELALAYVLQILRRTEEHVDQRPDERDQPERDRRPDEER